MSVSPSRRPRLALIGLSGYGRIHLQLARECRDRGEADIVAATVINPGDEAENVADLEAKGCRIYADYTEMLRRHAGEIDLCLIPTGIHWHARMTRAALQAGANVLVEKPFTSSVADARAVRALEAASGRFVTVGFQDCYDPGTRWLREELQRGAIGEVRAVRFLGVWPRPRRYFLRNNWAGRLQADGVPVLDSPLNNAFGHFVMLSLLFAGVETEEIRIRPDEAELFRAHAIESFDTGVVRLQTDRGVKVWLGASHVSHTAFEPEIVIEGTMGTARWSYEKAVALRDRTGAEQTRPILDQHVTRRLMMAAALRRLSDAETVVCTSQMATRHTALVEAVHRGTTIADFPPERISWAGGNGPEEAVPMVNGLDAAMRQAFATHGSLRAAGFVAGS